ncbi:MAG TPA: amino acid permease [Mucilaginibacter sp.]|jgi:APA family basic amino acid/polyamine antiporter|nr:amino acid permease [Mucilaginibacter sp.]
MAEQPAKLGLWTSTSLVVGSMIGAGVYLVPASMAAFGSISLFGWLFAAIGTFFIARVFSGLSKMVPGVAGGLYAYTRVGFGDFAAFLVGWGYLISVVTANAAIVVSFVGAMSTFFPALRTQPVDAVLLGLGAIWFLTWINNRGVKTSGEVQLITSILKILPLVVIAIGGLFFIRAANFHPFNATGSSTFEAITSAAAIAMFALVGIECATIPAENVENPEKTVSRATMIGLFVTVAVYLLGAVSIIGTIPAAELKNSASPYADAAVVIFGPGARYWAAGGAAIAAFGCLNGWILVQGQIPMALAQDKLFPDAFGWQNKKGAPYFGIIVSSVLMSLFMMMNYTKGLVDQFRFLSLLATINTLIPYLFCAAAYVIIRFTKKQFAGGWAAAIFVAVLAFAYSLWAIAGSGQSSVFWGFLLLMAGIPFYVWVLYKKRKANAEYPMSNDE